MPPTTEARRWTDTWPVRLAIVIGLTFALIFSVGVIVGFFTSHTGGGISSGDVLVGTPVVLFAALICWQLIVQVQRILGLGREKSGPRTRLVKTLWAFSIALGAVIGAATVLGTKKADHTSFGSTFRAALSEAPLPPGIALALLLALGIVALISIVYFRNIDEHERAAQGFASTIALNAYILVTLAWWIAARGGLAPPYDAAITFAIIVAIWYAGWLWQKYR